MSRHIPEHRLTGHEMCHQVGAGPHLIEVGPFCGTISNARAIQVDQDVRDRSGGPEITTLQLRGQHTDLAH